MASDSPSGLAGFGEEDIFCEPSLMNLVEQDSLKWIFVGGKGGVGKTTVSCSLGVQLAERGKKVLIVSTDPAHNLSDAFAQKFSTEPTPVHGLSRLACMEMDPSEVQANASAASNPQAAALQSALGGSGLAEGMMQMPGIDELMGLGALVRTLSSYDYDVIVFDTAPTGHTLRLLSLPSTALRLLDKLSGSGGLLSMAMNMLGGGADGQGGMGGMLDSLRATFTSVQEQFTNPDLTTFVPVCIPEFLSVFETERLVQELTDLGIDLHNIVVNQVLFPEGGPGDHADCQLCCARNRMQDKYLAQVDVLYGEDFHIVHMPIVTAEVRGLARLLAYSAFLMDPYTPSKHGYVTEAGFGGGVFVKPPRAGAVLPAPAPDTEGGAAPGAGPDSLGDDDLDAALADILG